MLLVFSNVIVGDVKNCLPCDYVQGAEISW